MDALDDPNVYLDIEVPSGCDLVWGFQLEPWDGTGTTANFNVTVNGSTTSYAMTVTVMNGGTQDAVTQFSIHLTPAQLATLGLTTAGNTATYNVRWMDSNSAVWGLGYGMVVATS